MLEDRSLAAPQRQRRAVSKPSGQPQFSECSSTGPFRPGARFRAGNLAAVTGWPLRFAGHSLREYPANLPFSRRRCGSAPGPPRATAGQDRAADLRSRADRTTRFYAMLNQQQIDGHPMPDQPYASDEDGRVVPFRPRRDRRNSGRSFLSNTHRTPVEDLSKYERSGEADDYRHRMIINAFAFVATIILILIGIWLANRMADLRRDDECLLSGRRYCNTTIVPRHGRHQQ